jgi:hypothetical protein
MKREPGTADVVVRADFAAIVAQDGAGRGGVARPAMLAGPGGYMPVDSAVVIKLQ